MSTQTVRRRLKEAGLKSCKPCKKPDLQPRHKAARLAFARQHRPWTRQQWMKVLFSDESRFCLRKVDGRLRVWRGEGERHTEACVVQQLAFNGGSIMVWGGICGTAKTYLVIINGNLNSQGYLTQIVQPHVIPISPAAGVGSV